MVSYNSVLGNMGPYLSWFRILFADQCYRSMALGQFQPVRSPPRTLPTWTLHIPSEPPKADLHDSVVFGTFMMTSSDGNIFRVTGLWCGEFTGQWPLCYQWPPCYQWPKLRCIDHTFEMKVANLADSHILRSLDLQTVIWHYAVV